MLTKIYLKSCSVKKLLVKRKKLWHDLLGLKIFAMGTLQSRMHYCRRKGCKCMNKEKPSPHGPYDYFAHRGGEKPGMLVLNKKQVKYAKKMIDNYNRIWNTLRAISSINTELLKRKYFNSI
jgi:hypothetical protein